VDERGTAGVAVDEALERDRERDRLPTQSALPKIQQRHTSS
jgi:hypothetical protein